MNIIKQIHQLSILFLLLVITMLSCTVNYSEPEFIEVNEPKIVNYILKWNFFFEGGISDEFIVNDTCLILGNYSGDIISMSLQSGETTYIAKSYSKIKGLLKADSGIFVLTRGGGLSYLNNDYDVQYELVLPGEFHAQPVFSNGKLIFQNLEGFIYIVDEKTSIISEIKIDNSWGMGFSNQILKDQFYYTISNNTVFSIDLDKCFIDETYNMETGNNLTDLCLLNGYIYTINEYGRIFCINPENNTMHEVYNLGKRSQYYIFSDKSDLFYQSKNCEIGCLYLKLEEILWYLIFNSKTYCRPLVAEDIIITGDALGNLYFIDRWLGHVISIQHICDNPIKNIKKYKNYLIVSDTFGGIYVLKEA